MRRTIKHYDATVIKDNDPIREYRVRGFLPKQPRGIRYWFLVAWAGALVVLLTVALLDCVRHGL